jgi:hypothetical protein
MAWGSVVLVLTTGCTPEGLCPFSPARGFAPRTPAGRTPSGALPLHPPWGVAPAPPVGRCPCIPVGALPHLVRWGLCPPHPRRGAAPASRWGRCPIWCGGGSAPHTPGGALPLHPGQEKRGLPPLLSWQSLIRPLCTARDDSPGHTLHGGLVFTWVQNCVRARRCTNVHPGRHTGSTRQRRVPALHNRAQMTTTRSQWQRRVPRALVHRGRPRGWALVTCIGKRKRKRAPQPQPQTPWVFDPPPGMKRGRVQQAPLVS